jgi:hypothetical protein
MHVECSLWPSLWHTYPVRDLQEEAQLHIALPIIRGKIQYTTGWVEQTKPTGDAEP